MINQHLNSNITFKQIENKIKFSLNINKIANATAWKPSISIWDGINMLLQEEKFKKSQYF